MESIPRPGLLGLENPEQVLTSRERDVDAWGRVSEPMRELGRYTNQLWEVVQSIREYLYDLAGENGNPSPLRSDDDWEAWAENWARVTSALAGPAGDSGHGVSEAREIAQRHGVAVRTGQAGT